MQVAACRVSVGGRRRWGRREDDAGAGAVCAVVNGSAGKGGERGVPGWRSGCLFCTWEEGGDGAAQGGGRREVEVVSTGCAGHSGETMEMMVRPREGLPREGDGFPRGWGEGICAWVMRWKEGDGDGRMGLGCCPGT
ncbi:hypothetical protein AAC387_Pa03g4365 [Persea americana]